MMRPAPFIDAGGLARWAEGATSGSALTLGRGAAVPPAVSPVVARLVDAGVINFARRRIGAGDFEFVAQRRSSPATRTKAASPRGCARAGSGRAGVAERRILKALTIAASRDLPCPTNAQLASVAGLSGALAASYRLGLLVKRGLIAVDVPADPRARRVVTIIATGATTRRNGG